jgi:hypothetical protein
MIQESAVQLPARYFLSFTASNPTLETAQPPIQWVPGAFPPLVKGDRVVKPITHFHQESSVSALPIRLHAVMHDYSLGRLCLCRLILTTAIFL